MNRQMIPIHERTTNHFVYLCTYCAICLCSKILLQADTFDSVNNGGRYKVSEKSLDTLKI